MIDPVFVGKKIANKMFKYYSNPLNRRKTFCWARFPETVKYWLKPRVWMHFPDNTDRAVLDLACQAAFDEASTLIKENNLT
jgi:hypothetical protein